MSSPATGCDVVLLLMKSVIKSIMKFLQYCVNNAEYDMFMVVEPEGLHERSVRSRTHGACCGLHLLARPARCYVHHGQHLSSGTAIALVILV